MKRFILTAVLFITIIGTAFADVVSFVTSAPRSVVVDQQFRISYKVNRVKVGEPTIPEIDGFRILTGPHRSTQRSMQMINGETTTSESVTFTYTLLAEKEGEFTIPAASIIVDGEKVTSNEAKIRVLPADQAGQSSQQGRSNGGGIQRNTTSTNISNDDLFIRASLNKTKVYEQEAVLLTYKVYSAVNLTNLDFPTPELKGFHIQEVELPKEKQFELDRYNGRNYQSLVWRQFVLFPQQSGKIEIPSLTFEGVVAVQTRRSMDPFEMMFNGGPSYVEVKKSIRTNSLTLNVEKLPAGKPAGFSGGVGKFSISSSISNNNLKTNEEVTLKVIVKGVGNMKLLGDPQIDFPSEFEVYDPIINNNFSLRSSGFTGEKVYEYVITPRSSGTYTIPAAKFSYFDTSSNSYRTIESESYTLDVEKGKDAPAATANSYIGKERGRVLATDIRHIKLDEGETKKEHTTLFGSTTYVLLYIIPLLLFIAYIIVYRRKMAENANLTLVRTKKANKVAVKRLKIANRLLKENRKNEFYDEILKTMWGYMSDKFNIPVANLTKENIREELDKQGVEQADIEQYMSVISECEYAQYAPAASGKMRELYTAGVEIVSKFESVIHR